jgi:hypothetical protein
MKFEVSDPEKLSSLADCSHVQDVWEWLWMFVQKPLELLSIRRGVGGGGKEQPDVMMKQVPSAVHGRNIK